MIAGEPFLLVRTIGIGNESRIGWRIDVPPGLIRPLGVEIEDVVDARKIENGAILIDRCRMAYAREKRRRLRVMKAVS